MKKFLIVFNCDEFKKFYYIKAADDIKAVGIALKRSGYSSINDAGIIGMTEILNKRYFNRNFKSITSIF